MPYQPELYAQDQLYGQYQQVATQQTPDQHRQVQPPHPDQRMYNNYGDPSLHFPVAAQPPQSYLPPQQQQQQYQQLPQQFYPHPSAPPHASFGNQNFLNQQAQFQQQHHPDVTSPQSFSSAPPPVQSHYQIQNQNVYPNTTNSPYVQHSIPPQQLHHSQPGYPGQPPPNAQYQGLGAGYVGLSLLSQFQQLPSHTSSSPYAQPTQGQTAPQRSTSIPKVVQHDSHMNDRRATAMPGRVPQATRQSLTPTQSPTIQQIQKQAPNAKPKNSYVPVINSPQQSRLPSGSSPRVLLQQGSPQIRSASASVPQKRPRDDPTSHLPQIASVHDSPQASPQVAVRKLNENTPTSKQTEKKATPRQNGDEVGVPRLVAEVRIPIDNSGPHKTPTRKVDDPHTPGQKGSSSTSQSTLNRPKLKQVQPPSQTSLPPTSSPLTVLNSSQFPSTPQPQPHPIDNQAVLLHLADEYISAAYKIGGLVAAPSSKEVQIDTYQSLMATAMGCLESALKNYRFTDPRKEARLRLRLANLMLDETDNYQEAGDVLDRGIALCERSRLVDLKYAMQHLSVRILHATNPQAALRALDKLIHETSLMKLQHWVYAFRFCRVSLSLASFTHTDMVPLLKNLQMLYESAEHERRPAIVIIASIMEAMVHLKSGAHDTVELAQRALARARTHQLSDSMQQMPQIPSLLDCVEIACHTLQFSPEQVHSKLQHLHQSMDQSSRDAGWATDGSIWVSLGTAASKEIEDDAEGIMKTLDDGNTALVLKWLTRNQAYILSYLLSGIVHGHKGNGDGRCEPYLMEGLKLCDALPMDLPQSLTSARSMIDWQMSKRIASRLQLIFDYCGRANWGAASAAIQDFHRYLPLNNSQPDPGATTLLMYLGATCNQGQGELEAAYATYKRAELTFDPRGKGITADRDIRVLATLNSVLILRCINQHDQILADMLVHSVEDYCLKHHNKAILAAYYIIKTTGEEPDGMILKTKQHLQSAVQAARTSGSNQLLCIVMSLMSSLYFTNIVGDQAEKSVSASRSLAKKSHSDLWLAVTDGMLADTCELMGKHDNARLAREEAAEVYAKIPELVKQRIKTMYDDV